VRLPAKILIADGTEWDEAVIHDLSAGGAAIHTRRVIPVQSEVRLRFSLAESADAADAPIEVGALVVRTGTTGSDRQVVAGLHFLDLHGADFDRVRVFVWNLIATDDRNA
jgi:hypothetical protein